MESKIETNTKPVEQTIAEIATRVRQELEAYYGCEDDPEAMDGMCHKVSERLCDELKIAGFNALRVPGRYMGASSEYEPDMSQWDDEDRHTFDGSEGFNHWWVQVDNLIIDITADQFHPQDREDHKVTVVGADDPDYNFQQSPTASDVRPRFR